MRAWAWLALALAGGARAALGDSAAEPARSCEQLAAARCGAPSGVYHLAGGQRWCELDADGGGWTAVAYRAGGADACPAAWALDAPRCILPAAADFGAQAVGVEFGAPHAFRAVRARVGVWGRAALDAFNGGGVNALDGVELRVPTGDVHVFGYALGYSQTLLDQADDRANYCPCPGSPFLANDETRRTMARAGDRWFCDARSDGDTATWREMYRSGTGCAAPGRDFLSDTVRVDLAEPANAIEMRLTRTIGDEFVGVSDYFIHVRETPDFDRRAACATANTPAPSTLAQTPQPPPPPPTPRPPTPSPPTPRPPTPQPPTPVPLTPAPPTIAPPLYSACPQALTCAQCLAPSTMTCVWCTMPGAGGGSVCLSKCAAPGALLAAAPNECVVDDGGTDKPVRATNARGGPPQIDGAPQVAADSPQADASTPASSGLDNNVIGAILGALGGCILCVALAVCFVRSRNDDDAHRDIYDPHMVASEPPLPPSYPRLDEADSIAPPDPILASPALAVHEMYSSVPRSPRADAGTGAVPYGDVPTAGQIDAAPGALSYDIVTPDQYDAL